MEYLIPALLVLIIVGGFVTFMVLNATKKSGPVAETDEEGAPGIGGDETPLGDTTEHAGTQSAHGTTVDDPEAARPRADDPDAAAHVARPGEGEGHQRLEFEGTQPAGPGAGARAVSHAAGRTTEATEAAAQDAPDEPGADEDAPDRAAPDAQGAEADDRSGAPKPASERLADRGF